jgi:hypothetical protein
MHFERLIIALLSVLVGCTRTNSTFRFGIVDADRNGIVCATFDGPAVAAGTRVTVHLFHFHTEPTVLAGRIGETRSACNGTADLPGISYSVAPDQKLSSADDIGTGIGVLGSDDTGELQFKECASSEGVHYTVWRGNQCSWHRYYYVAYDMEPNCPDDEVARWPDTENR